MRHVVRRVFVRLSVWNLSIIYCIANLRNTKQGSYFKYNHLTYQKK